MRGFVNHYKEERNEQNTYGNGYNHSEEYTCTDGLSAG